MTYYYKRATSNNGTLGIGKKTTPRLLSLLIVSDIVLSRIITKITVATKTKKITTIVKEPPATRVL